MATHTLAIIKPDAVQRGLVGTVLHHAEQHGLLPVTLRMIKPAPGFWEAFYAEHEGKPFYEELCRFMDSGPSVFAILELEREGRPEAVSLWRGLLGATDPKKALPGTLRRLYGTGGPANVAHGSASDEDAAREIVLIRDRLGIVLPPGLL